MNKKVIKCAFARSGMGCALHICTLCSVRASLGAGRAARAALGVSRAARAALGVSHAARAALRSTLTRCTRHLSSCARHIFRCPGGTIVGGGQDCFSYSLFIIESLFGTYSPLFVLTNCIISIVLFSSPCIL